MSDLRLVQVQAQSGIGNQDVVITDFGTPTFVMILATDAGTLDTKNNDAALCQGMYDGTTVGCNFTNCEDNVTASDDHNGHSSTQIVYISDPGTGNSLRDCSVTFIPDGVRLNWAQAAGNQPQLMILLVTGTSAYVTNALPGTSPGNNVQPTSGFQTKLGFVSANRSSSSNTNGERLSLGVWHYNGTTITQRSMYSTQQNNVADVTPRARVATDRVAIELNNTTGAYDASMEITAADTTKVTIVTRTDDFDGGIMVVGCLELTGETVKIGSIDSPTSAAADWASASLGFQPQIFGLLMNRCTTEDALNGTTNAGLTMHYMADDSGEEISAGYGKQDVATGQNTWSYTSSKLFALNDAHATMFDMNSPDFNADDFTFPSANITTVDGTARKWIYWAVEAEVTITDVDTDDIVGAAQTPWTITGTGFGAD